MATFTEVAALVPTLRDRIGACASAEQAQTAIAAMTDLEVEAVLRDANAVVQIGEQMRLLSAGVIAARSTWKAGHSGAAQKRGHRNAVSLVQQITGSTKAEASRQVRVGEAMLGGECASANGTEPDAAEAEDTDAGASEADAGESSTHGGNEQNSDSWDWGASLGGSGAEESDSDAAGSPAPEPDAKPRPTDWLAPLRAARRDGVISTAQFDAVQRGLGDPPTAGGDIDEQTRRRLDEGARQAWQQAAEQLVAEAGERTVEELGAAARSIRDLLDPEGAEARFLARHERRCYRSWIDQDGVRRASIVYDDEGGALMDSIFNAALRPRRGGPRFVDSEEKKKADDLTRDPRTNDQLGYDLLLDLVRAGAFAEAKDVFGTRQAGVRLVQVVDGEGNAQAVGHTEDGLSTMPGAGIAQHICDSGTVTVTVDGCGNPLDVGREQRLFTPRQRIALAIRDGGCRWSGCDRPASYCESHHVDEWQRDSGRTDIDRGILLCRYHHMQLHHGDWRITRDSKGEFILHDRGGGVHQLRPRAFLSCVWGDIEPPPKRFRPMVA